MARYILKRLALLVPVLLIMSVVVFGVLRMGKTDPAQAWLRISGIRVTETSLAQARNDLGLNKPIVVQYGEWLSGAIRLDFGNSYVNGNPALQDIVGYMPVTLKLTFAAILATVLISVPLGVLAAVYKDGWADWLTRIFAFGGVSMPSFWLGFLLVYLFSIHLGWLPAMGLAGPLSYILPVLTLSFMSIGINIRLVRASMLEHMHSRFVTYAEARGVGRRQVVMKHVLRSALLPVVTSLGMHFGEMLGGAVIVENIFNLPGVGRYVVTAINNHDYPVIQAFTILTTGFFIILNLGVDVLYAAIDPRIRLAENPHRGRTSREASA